ncbi:hypothetical protein EC988_002810 [Linderina pennispora]|nr:hypothetical protein EC988_002810 [Linderina pennispora]
MEGQQWSGEQEIDDFIRMVDENKSLKMFGKRPGTHTEPSSVADAPAASKATAGVGRRNTLSSGPGDRSARNQQSTRGLTKYHGLVHEFDGLSRDMQDSIAQLHVDTTNLSGASNDGDMTGSPFLRKAIPNPFKSTDSTMRSVSQSDSDAPAQSAGTLRPASSKKVAASPKTPSKSQSSAIAADGEKRSLHSLEEAFKGLVIDSHPDTPQQISYYSPNMTSLPAGHIRDAAPGLDSERERPLPMPMSIPRSSSSTTRGPSRPQRTRPDDVFEAVPPAGARGKSQPTANMALYSPAAPRAATPQPPTQTLVAQPDMTHHPVPMLTPRRTSHMQIAHRSQSQSPDSQHSDYTAGTRRLEALLGMGDSGRASPRSTPNTPSPGVSRIMQESSQPVDLRDGRSTSESRRRRQQHQQQQTGRRHQDSLRSNFPPFSFIMPRNKTDIPAGEPMANSPGSRGVAGTSSPPSRSEMVLSHESPSAVTDENERGDDDEEMMFQMDASMD